LKNIYQLCLFLKHFFPPFSLPFRLYHSIDMTPPMTLCSWTSFNAEHKVTLSFS
jgi:hypothetical protein